MIFSIVNAKSPEEAGLEIAKKMDEADKGYLGEESIMNLILSDASGNKVNREMEGKSLEVENDSSKSLITFLNPKDVKGTKMLTWGHKNADDEQWLYLQSLKRVKKISSGEKSSAFMASEFTYEDIGSQNIEKYNFKLLSEDKENWTIERTPKQESGYSKQTIVVSKKMISTLSVTYFDRRGEKLKEATFSDFKSYKIGSREVYRPNKIHIKNVQTKKESIFEWSNRKLGVKHADRIFDQRSLK